MFRSTAPILASFRVPIACAHLLALAAFVVVAPLATQAALAQPPAAAPDWARIGVPGVASVAVNDDVSALFVNPAAIDRSVPGGFHFSWAEGEDRGLDLLTAGFTAGAFGFAYQQVRPPGEENLGRWIFGLGGGTRAPFSFGIRGTYEHRGRLGPDDSAWRWDAGLLWRPRNVVSLGALASDLNQGRLVERGDIYERSYTLGVGLRPLPPDRFSRLTLFADLKGGENQVWKDDALLEAGLAVEPIPGVELAGSVGGALGDLSGERAFRFAVASTTSTPRPRSAPISTATTSTPARSTRSRRRARGSAP
jgi:hypothetical protein